MDGAVLDIEIGLGEYGVESGIGFMIILGEFGVMSIAVFENEIGTKCFIKLGELEYIQVIS